ncbi:hypothetical protein FM103_18695 [Corynebacterium xerosis]|nr:hypothetical protein FM103_18695 [Corynebacterium xerosis]
MGSCGAPVGTAPRPRFRQAYRCERRWEPSQVLPTCETPNTRHGAGSPTLVGATRVACRGRGLRCPGAPSWLISPTCLLEVRWVGS